MTTSEEIHLSVGDVVYISCEEKYYWEGDIALVLSAVCAANLINVLE